MVTPLSLLVAIIAICVTASALMLLLMVVASPTPAWYRRLNIGSVALGMFMVLAGIFEVATGRRNERTDRLSYYRGAAPVTPAQSYAAGVGLMALGSIATVGAIIHRRSTSYTS